MRILVLLSLIFLSYGAMASNMFTPIGEVGRQQLTVLPKIILNSADVMQELARGAADADKQWKEHSDELDAVKDVYLDFTRHGVAQYTYQFVFFSAEHYICDTIVFTDLRKNLVEIRKKYSCEIEE